MKRIDLIKILTKSGCVLVRHGGKHDWFMNTTTKISQPIPRHRKIGESLAKHIIKKLK
ncbi:MAG: type II toxin-antitoxin system HicA family toxin [Candidatus Sabulitectum sp.]|nr:type II toxin-antitoxin system HicA family toxin [Candidatus Sabulitectum sp.]